MLLKLRDDIKTWYPNNAILFSELMSVQGDVFRCVYCRETLRFKHQGQAYFIKKHFGVGWKEILKSLFHGRFPILTALNEWNALRYLAKQGLCVPGVAAFGKKGRNPARIKSFIVMDALENTKSLNDLAIEWRKRSPRPRLKRALIKEVARIMRIMHQAGVNHRDCYILHFRLSQSIITDLPEEPLKLYLIDLHRAQIRKHIPYRWRLKDLAGLYFSSLDVSLSKKDYFRFMKEYSNKPLKTIIQNEKSLWETVHKKGNILYDKHKE